MWPCRFQRLFATGLVLSSGLAPLTAEEVKSLAIGEPQFRVTRWTAENGLPQNNARALAQTSDGYLWIGTLYGLARFDGVRFTVFDHGNTPEMVSDAINDLTADANDSSLWIATGNGLLRYRGNQFERFGAERGIREIGQVWPALEGGVWISQGAGKLALVQNSKIQEWDLGQRGFPNHVRSFFEESPTEVVLVVDWNICRLNRITGSCTLLKAPHEQFICHWVTRDQDTSLWLSGRDGIWHGKEGAWTHVVTVDPEVPPWPGKMSPAADGGLWVDIQSHLHRLADGRLEPLAAPGLPQGLKVSRLLEDNEGSLWLGGSEGLFQLRRAQVQIFSTHEGLKGDDVQSVTHGPDGTIWVGTQGFNGIQDGHVFDVPAPPVHGEGLWSAVILADHDGSLWFGTSGRRLMGYHAGNWKQLDAPPEIEAGWRNPSALYQDRLHRIWIATSGSVACQDKGQWRLYSLGTNNSRETSVRVIHQDPRGDMWFGTYGSGLYRLREGKMTSFRTSLGEYNNRAWSIHEDAEGVFWIGSQNGLNRFVPPGIAQDETNPASTARGEGEGQFFTFTTAHGLGENVVNNIQEDDFGCLWLSGQRGIYRIARSELDLVAVGKQQEVRCVVYGEADGMPSSECNGGDHQPAGCKDALGRVWFPTTKGLALIDPGAVHRNEVPPPVVIEQVTADNKVIYGDGEAERPKPAGNSERFPSGAVRLGPGRAQALKIRFSANSFIAPERIRFKYQLEGWDGNWREAERNERMAVYTNLRPGNYRFRVKACNHHGYWSTSDALFAFSLAPHVWQTSWFYTGFALAVIGVAVGIQSYRLRWQRRILKLEERHALASERARIARDLHDDLGANLTGIALKADLAQRQLQGSAAGAAQLGEIATRARALVDNMRDTIWALNPKHDTLEGLARFLAQHVEDFVTGAGLRCRLELPDAFPEITIPSPARYHIHMIVKEALHNALKHGGAREVHFSLKAEGDNLWFRICDDGCGFDVNSSQATGSSGNGLPNMRQRAQSLNGELRIEPSHQGTSIIVRIPTDSFHPGKA